MRACAYLLPVDGVAREMPGSGFVSVIALELVLPPLRLVTHAFPTLPQAKRLNAFPINRARLRPRSHAFFTLSKFLMRIAPSIARKARACGNIVC